MSMREQLEQFRRANNFDASTATREDLIAHLEALEALYCAHPAQLALEQIHRYLYPERYANVALYEWDAGTIEEVADRVEHALPAAPRSGETTR